MELIIEIIIKYQKEKRNNNSNERKNRVGVIPKKEGFGCPDFALWKEIILVASHHSFS